MTHPTSADICRANGWTVGDVLERASEIGRSRIRITAVGENSILARWQYSNNAESEEQLINLDSREWHKVGQK